MEKIKCSVAIQVLPQVEGAKVIGIVDRVIDYIESFNLKMVVGPFETVVEGDLPELMELIEGCVRLCVSAGAPHVLSYVKIHYSPDGIWSIGEKVNKHNG